jgi:hypothetical protein
MLVRSNDPLLDPAQPEPMVAWLKDRFMHFVSSSYIKLIAAHSLVEEPNDLPSNMLPSRLFVVHNSGGCRENNVSELTRRQKLDDPLLHFGETDIVARRDDTGLI